MSTVWILLRCSFSPDFEPDGTAAWHTLWPADRSGFADGNFFFDDHKSILDYCTALLSDFQFLNYFAIAVYMSFHKIIEKTAALADHPKQSEARMMVLLVSAEM